MKIQSSSPLGYFLLLTLTLFQARFTTATNGVIPAVVPGAAVPGTVIPLATSHQFVTRNWNRNVYVPTTTVAAYPTNPYYKYSGGYPQYPQYPVYNYPYTPTAYQYTYPYYYPTYNYGYGYRGVW